MASVASKNLFELLGNDPDEDGQVKLPTIPVEKPVQRKGKRNGVDEAPVVAAPAPAARGGRGGRGGRRGDATGSERAFQDRDNGRSNNRDKPVDDGLRRDRHSNTLEGGRIQRGGRFDGRGGRGGAGGRNSRGGRDDRHSRTGIADHPKQAEKGWGEETAAGELNDEKAGDQIAEEEKKDGFDATVEKPVNADGETLEVAPEEEDKTKSYEAYLAELAEKKLALGSTYSLRQANEGSKVKVPEGHEIEREEGAVYFVGSGSKQARQREKKDKNFLALDHDLIARENASPRGGARGGRGRGRGDGAPRRGSGRGGRGEFRGEFRGSRGGPRGGPAAPSIGDASAFPSLGA